MEPVTLENLRLWYAAASRRSAPRTVEERERGVPALAIPHLTDEELVECYNRGVTADEAMPYLEALLGRYRKKVIGWCWHMTGAREEAADLAQDIFLKVLKSLGGFRGESRFSTWLYKIARNRCNDFLRRRRSALFKSLEDSDAILNQKMPTGPSPEQRLDREEALRVFMNLVRTVLTDTERKVAYMHFADGVQLPEITEMLALTNKSGAKAYLVSAKRKLQERMTRWLETRGLRVSELF